MGENKLREGRIPRLSSTLAAVCAILLADLTCNAAQYDLYPATNIQEGSQFMQDGLRRVVFERSGGPLHLTIGGVVKFHDGTAEVTSNSSQNRRELTPEEQQLFEKLDYAKLDASVFGSNSAGPPDRYQYDLVLEGANGHRIELRFHEEPASALNEKVPGLGDLAEWIRREIAAIWKQKSAR